MAYIPISQRKSFVPQSIGGYTPVNERDGNDFNVKQASIKQLFDEPITLDSSFDTQKTTPMFRDKEPVVGPFAKEVGQSIARNIGSAGLTISGAIQGDIAEPLKSEDFSSFFGQALFETVFGKGEQVKPIETRIAEAEPKLKKWQGELLELSKEPTLNARERTVTKILSGLDTEKLAFSGIMGAVGIDLTPFGGSRKSVTIAIKNVTNVGDGIKIGRQLNIADDLLQGFATDAIKITTTKQADDFLTSIVKLQSTTKAKGVYTPVAQRGADAPMNLDELQLQKGFIEDSVKTNEARKIVKYTGKGDDSLAEIQKRAETRGLKSVKLDEEITELGFKDLDEAQTALDKYRIDKGRLLDITEDIKKAKAATFKVAPQEKLAVKTTEVSKTIINEARKFKSADDFIKGISRDKLEVLKQEMIDAGQDISLSGSRLPKAEWREQVYKPALTDIWNQAIAKAISTPKGLPPIPPKIPSKRIPSAKRIVGREPAEKITTAEDVLLRKKLRTEARGAKGGVKAERKRVSSRRTQLRIAQDRFNLTNAELSSIRKGRDIRTMSDEEFEAFMNTVETKAARILEKSEALVQLKGTIFEKELIKTENLQKAYKLPTIQKMTTKQLQEFDKTLQQYKTGDEFFSVRKLETVDNTDLKGIKTIREARERLAKEMGVKVDELSNIKVAELDRFRYDTALAEKNNFYKLMVDTTNENLLNAEARYLKIEHEVNKLTKEARKSRNRSVADVLIPQDKRVFKYLETPVEGKAALAKSMTPEELKLANFVAERYAEMRDYLVQMETLKKYRSDYITHIRRGFLEQWKETGLLNAFKSVFKQYKQDQAIFNILDSKTSEILPLEKFFKFSMRRTGDLDPTENVAKAFLNYTNSFEKKVALDAIVPKLDIYAQSLTSKVTTPRGLEFDQSLKNFLNEWMNTKKGRQTSFLGVQQGGKLDVIMRTGKMFTVLLDLGLNIPVGIAARAGENITTFTMLGTRNYARGLARARTKQGKTIIEKYKNFVGRTPWDEIQDASKDIGEKFTTGLMGLFADATVRANKTFLLGSLSKEEWKTGVLTTKRLAQLKKDLGRYRVVEGAKSVIGATTPGSIATQYKSWAIPIVRTTISNLTTMAKMLRTGKSNEIIKSREFQEMFRATMASLLIVFTVRGVMGIDDKKNKTFSETVLSKAYRDALTFAGALTPQTMAGIPRLLTFVEDLSKNLTDIEKLTTQLTPRAIKQFIPKDKKVSTSGTVKTPEGLPEIPSLKSSLPPLPKLPSI